MILTNQYDSLNRLTNRASAGGYQVQWAYNTVGQRTNMVDASGTNTYAYDNRDRLLTNQWFVIGTNQSVTLTYSYDDFGNLATIKSLTSGGVALTNSFDSLNRLATVAQASGLCSYGYDAVGNLQTLRLPNAVTNTWTYDALSRLTNLTVTAASGTLASFAYKLAPAGNRTNLSETISGNSRTFAWDYDPLYRLTNEVLAGASPMGTNSYKYDAVGNRTNRTSVGLGLTNQTFAYTVNDRLTIDGHDANGSTTNSSGNTYRYDPENRLTNAIVGGTSITYVYDGDGNRVRKIVGTTTNTYVVCRQNLTGYAQVLEEHVNGTLSKVYAYGLDLISQRDVTTSDTWYFGYDGLGSIRLLTTTNATVANAFTYDAFGTLIASNAAPQTDYLFAGEQRDANLGFYYLRARYLNPGTGRLWTRDNYAGSIFDPPSLHRYTYCANNPVNCMDPSGHEFLPSALAAIAIAVILVAVDVGLISQVTVNYRKYFGLGDRNRQLALQHNNDVIAALQRIIASEGERTFQDEHLGVGGQMGTILPGSGPFQEAANLFESFPWNIEGYPTAIEEWFARISTDSFNPTPVEDSIAGTPEKRVVLARALLHRQEAFGRWLKRNL